MEKRTQSLFTLTGLAVLAALLFAVVLLSNVLLRGVRIDLTENKLYSMSPGTRNILENIDEPINLYFFFSDTEAREATQLRAYAQRVRELLEEFELAADGKVNLEVIDPLPFSEEEDQAAQFGLQAVPFGLAGQSIYFGLAGTNSLDDKTVIPFFQDGKEAFLEYDLAKVVHSLANPKRPVIGLMSWLDASGGFDPSTMQQTPPWMLVSQIRQLFELRTVDTGADRVDAEIDVLMVVHPKIVSDATLYAIDQFVLGGGRVIVFVDPHSDVDRPPQDPNNPAAMLQSRASNLKKLFDAWGLVFDENKFIGDDRYALLVRGGPGQRDARHLGLLGFLADAMSQDDVVTADLNVINAGFPGAFSLADDATVELIPLIATSDQAGLIDTQKVRFMADPQSLRSDFTPTGEAYVVAGRVQGSLTTAFPDGKPGGDADADGGEGSDEPDAAAEHLAESTEPANLIVVGDTDLLTDRFWVQVQDFFGQRIAQAFANNGDFVFNAIDNLTGSTDLISVRGRATYRRPFLKVEELERAADERFRQTEQRLQAELAQTEQRLAELQESRDDENTLIMTAAQRAEIDNFLSEKLRIRKELRQVRADLDKDIKRLGFGLKAINIALMPLIVIAFAVFRYWRRYAAK